MSDRVPSFWPLASIDQRIHCNMHMVDALAGNRVQDAMAIPSKFAADRPFAKPEVAARKLLEIADELPIDQGRICIGKWNSIFLAAGGNVAEYTAGRDKAATDGLIEIHECGAFIMLTGRICERF
jgi:hypothetical protein